MNYPEAKAVIGRDIDDLNRLRPDQIATRLWADGDRGEPRKSCECILAMRWRRLTGFVVQVVPASINCSLGWVTVIDPDKYDVQPVITFTGNLDEFARHFDRWQFPALVGSTVAERGEDKG